MWNVCSIFFLFQIWRLMPLCAAFPNICVQIAWKQFDAHNLLPEENIGLPHFLHSEAKILLSAHRVSLSKSFTMEKRVGWNLTNCEFAIGSIFLACIHILSGKEEKKSCILETLNLSTCADIRTDKKKLKNLGMKRIYICIGLFTVHNFGWRSKKKNRNFCLFFKGGGEGVFFLLCIYFQRIGV